ncbi:DUF4926 domain-containing protein [Leptolyngbya sp. CCNP1308]|uniref:DUF4926 domain-containing protein n=1 Tax=Leptolyngbya sp. CCNP1308 TaxID=3110255 RepID=UPI002B21189C|nr:DUF4926 domain-containing protein [Leptolyngbya sp. CCNP1308]MEA5452495.1 DUF4926 domain-containing protein [Leptolyngbya sp. CCNP1308]
MALALFDSVATLQPIDVARLTLVEPVEGAAEQLARGQVGTVVDVVDQDESKQYLVEVADLEGREYAMAYLMESELLLLHYQFTAA